MLPSRLLLLLASISLVLKSIFAEEKDTCRTVQWKSPVPNKAFTGHVIKNVTVTTQTVCEIQCYLEPDCTSFNFKRDSLNCELSSSNDEVHPSALVDCQQCVYRAIKSNCVNVQCPSPNMICQSGYGDIDGYRCVCSKCYKGDLCDEGTFVLQFSRSFHLDHVLYDKHLNMIAFTVSFWLQTSDSHTTGSIGQSPVNIATPKSANALLIQLTTTRITLYVGSDASRTIQTSVLDGQWHHICATWENTAGSWTFNIDGAIAAQGTGFSTGFDFTQGVVVLGQDQDRYPAGKFDEYESFNGNLTSVNIWNRVLPSEDILKLATQCPSGRGNVVNWTNLISGVNGAIEMKCPAKCGP